MTQTPDPHDPHQPGSNPDDTSPLPPAPPPPPHGDPVTGHGEQWGQEVPPPPPSYDPSQQQPGYGQPPPPAYPQQGFQQGFPQGQAGAPYGIHPGTGIPYSDKSKLAAGLLNIFIAGVGRMYIGQVGLGVAQLLVTIFTCGIGALWPIIDGILILTKDDAKDAQGRILKS
jgi:TM2 domain-containing membrane protein YozV